MQLETLAKKAELIKLVVDDEDTVREFNEPVEFWTYDRAPIEVYLKLHQAQMTGDVDTSIQIVKTLILDARGKRVMSEDQILPAQLLARCIGKIMEKLGN